MLEDSPLTRFFRKIYVLKAIEREKKNKHLLVEYYLLRVKNPLIAFK